MLEGRCWSACVVSIECAHGWAMADLSKVLSLNQEKGSSVESKTLKTRTKVKTQFGVDSRSANFTRDQFTSELLWVKVLPRVMQYQISYLMMSYVDIIVYLEVIENPIENQYELWNVWGTRAETEGICLQAYSSKYTSLRSCNVTFIWRLENLQKSKNRNVSVVQRW